MAGYRGAHSTPRPTIYAAPVTMATIITQHISDYLGVSTERLRSGYLVPNDVGKIKGVEEDIIETIN